MVRNDGALLGEPIDVFCLFCEERFWDEQWEVGVDVPRLFEHVVEGSLHQFPHSVAMGFDDHATSDRAVLGQVSSLDQVVVPISVILAAWGNPKFLTHQSVDFDTERVEGLGLRIIWERSGLTELFFAGLDPVASRDGGRCSVDANEERSDVNGLRQRDHCNAQVSSTAVRHEHPNNSGTRGKVFNSPATRRYRYLDPKSLKGTRSLAVTLMVILLSIGILIFGLGFLVYELVPLEIYWFGGAAIVLGLLPLLMLKRERLDKDALADTVWTDGEKLFVSFVLVVDLGEQGPKINSCICVY